MAGGGEYPSGNRAISFDRSGKGFYYITNKRGRAAELAWMPLEATEEIVTEYITAEIPWDVSDFALSDDGSRGAFVTNEEGISRLYLLDTESNRFRKVSKLPVGLITEPMFSPDNSQLAFNLSTSQTPNDVYVLELGRIVMEDTAERLQNATDIQEFYLGLKDQGVRGRRRWKQRKTWR